MSHGKLQIAREGHTTHCETPRAELESAFTPILRKIWLSSEAVLVACLVDCEGECIDYCTSLSVYDAKLAGAHLALLLSQLDAASPKLLASKGAGTLHLITERRELIVRRVGSDYALAVVLAESPPTSLVNQAIMTAEESLRKEMGLEVSPYHPEATPVQVATHPDPRGSYVPVEVSDGPATQRVESVLGRWEESDRTGAEQQRGFRVRGADGREMNLIHNVRDNTWMRERW